MRRVRRIFPACVGLVLLAAAGFAILRAWQPLRVTGESMMPALHAGDLVFVERRTSAKVGDIVLVRRPGQAAVLHRVIERAVDGSLVTKGDANPTPDIRTVADEHAAGRVAGVLPVGALVARWR